MARPDAPRAAAPQPPVLGLGARGAIGPGGGFAATARAQDPRGTLRRLWDYLARQRGLLTGVVVLTAVTTGLNLLGPYLLGLAIDRFIVEHDLPGLARLIGWMLAVYAGLSLASYLQSVLMIRAAQQTVAGLRADVFARLQILSLRFFDRHTHGELMSRITNDVENVNTVLTSSVVSFLSSIFSLGGVVVVMLAVNVPLALLSMATVPLMAGLTRYIATNSRRSFREPQAALGALNGQIEETITGARTIQAFGRAEAVCEEFDRTNRRLAAAAIRAQTYSGLLGPIGNLASNLGFTIVAAGGGWIALQGLATVGTVASFLGYSQQLRRPVNDIASLFNTIQAALAGAERIFAVLDEAAVDADDAGAAPLASIDGRVTFDDVSFSYTPGVPVLHDVTLAAQPGQTVALVGPTGAGKTTLINLLSRFYDVDAGAIRIDGRDIRTLRKTDLRQQLGIVLQDTFLFSATVMENIRYGRLDATDDDVIAAARLANADHFIHRLPHGYATMLSERAGNLSQGQRQLLAIARAVLADPGILVLDEATSSVDTRTERQIQEALLRLMRGRTSFVVAHRLSTIREADAILVLRDGRIVEQGDHAALMARRGFYYRLTRSQFRGASSPVAGQQLEAEAPHAV